MSAPMQFDAELSRRIEATYTTADVVEQRRVVIDRLALRAGEDVLDIGSGPGLLACEMAAVVGSEGSVHGIDPSESMRAIARARRPREDSAPVTFGVGNANALPFTDASFDVVTSTQVYEYVADVAGALAEAHRVLRPGGRLLVLDTDWDSIVWHSRDSTRMRRVLAAWDEHLVDPYLPRRLARLLRGAGFVVSHCAAIPLLNTSYHSDTYSAGLIGFITAFVPGHHSLTDTDVQAWADDLTSLDDDYFFSLNRYLFIATSRA
jgi:arsenite methyltransferase